MKLPKLGNHTKRVIISTLIALCIGLAAGALILGISGYNPLHVYGIMLEKVSTDFGQVVGVTTPLIFTGLAVALPSTVGLVNLGAEGQMIAGALVASIVGAQITGLPAWIHIPLVALSGIVTGMVLSGFCGWLKIRFRANEVVTTVMLNSVVSLVGEYLVNGPLNGATGMPQTAMIQESAIIHKFNPTDLWSATIFIGIAAAILIWVFLKKTVLGYEVQAAGLNSSAAAYKGINTKRAALLAMALGGAMAGLGGACEVMSAQHSYFQSFLDDYGFTGIGVARIAWDNPIAIIPSAFFLGAIRVGGFAIDRIVGIPSQFIWLLQGVVIIALAIPNLSSEIIEMCKSIKKKGSSVIRRKTINKCSTWRQG